MECVGLHFELHVSNLGSARRFYVELLGLPVLQDTPGMHLLAVRIGGSRLSIFGDRTDASGPGPSQIILAVENIDEAIAELQSRGVTLSGPPVAAGTFLRFATTKDPDGKRGGDFAVSARSGRGDLGRGRLHGSAGPFCPHRHHRRSGRRAELGRFGHDAPGRRAGPRRPIGGARRASRTPCSAKNRPA